MIKNELNIEANVVYYHECTKAFELGNKKNN